jgi:hypothetical protein
MQRLNLRVRDFHQNGRWRFVLTEAMLSLPAKAHAGGVEGAAAEGRRQGPTIMWWQQL